MGAGTNLEPRIESALTYFLIRKLSDSIREALERDSREQSVQETIRGILCAHYELECPPLTGSWPRDDARAGAQTILVRMHPELWAALKEDASETGESMQALTHAALAAHYSESAVT